jgi:hypothetical protein
MKIGLTILLSIFIVSCGTQAITPSPVATLDEKIVLYESINQVLGSDNQNAPRLTKISYDVPERSDIAITEDL